MKKIKDDKDKKQDLSVQQKVEEMREVCSEAEEIKKEEWAQDSQKGQTKQKEKFKDYRANILRGEGINPKLKKDKRLGGVRGKFHPSKKGTKG